MNDLDDRLRSLAERPVPGPATPDDLRRRATDRRARRARRQWATTATVVIVVAALLGWQATRRSDDPSVGSSGTTTATTPVTTRPATRVLGDVNGVDVTIEPSTDLVDGQTVHVRIPGFSTVSGGTLALCADDADERSALTGRCEQGAVSLPPPTGSAPVVVAFDQDLVVDRVLDLSTAAGPERYDCAVRPCSIGVLTSAPRGPGLLLTSVSFRNSPWVPPGLMLERTAGLRAGESVGYTAVGLGPDSPYGVRLCGTAARPETPLTDCDSVVVPTATTADGSGAGRGTIAVRVELYTSRGRVDCTAEPCVAMLLGRRNEPLVRVPLAFGDDVVAATPQLRVVEPGPHRHGQIVTVTGTGFPPGLDLERWVLLCPEGEERSRTPRCDRLREPAVVARDGTFTSTLQLTLDRCGPGSACRLAWAQMSGARTAHSAPIVILP